MGIDCPPMPGGALADPGSGAGAEIRDLLARGKKIEAIKRYREETGAGLAEAKSAVEAIEAGGAPQPPRPDIGL